MGSGRRGALHCGGLRCPYGGDPLGAGAAGTRTAGKTGGALLCAAGLSLTLLTAGCLIGGKIQEPSGVLSAASFSFAGCLMGSLMFGRKNAETNRSSFRTKRKQIRKG